MKKLLFIFLAVLILGVSCASGGYTFGYEGSLGAEIKDEKGNGGFCKYNQEVTKETFAQDLTCNVDIIVEDGIIRCEKLKLSHVYKDFKLEANCYYILKKEPEEAESS